MRQTLQLCRVPWQMHSTNAYILPSALSKTLGKIIILNAQDGHFDESFVISTRQSADLPSVTLGKVPKPYLFLLFCRAEGIMCPTQTNITGITHISHTIHIEIYITINITKSS